MFQLFWKKRREIEEFLREYFSTTDLCFEQFHKAMKVFVEQKRCDEFVEMVDETRILESKADRLRRDLELTLYSQALLPESRGDLLGLLEQFDRIPNRAETCLFIIKCQHLNWPESLNQDLLSLVECNLEAYRLIRQAVDALFHQPKKTLYICKEVMVKESESDRRERELIERVFVELDCSFGEKALLKELVLAIGNISDRCETTADRISIVSIKRQI